MEGGARLDVIGPMAAAVGGTAVDLGGPNQRTVLAMLALRPGEVVAADLIAEAVWGDEAGQRARTTLHVYISNLRKALGPAGPEAIVTVPPGYRLDPRKIELDLTEFRREAEQGEQQAQRGFPDAAARLFVTALARCRGPLAADVPGDETIDAARRAFEEERLTLLEARYELGLAAGSGADLVPELTALVEEHPLRERLWGALMLSLSRAGRQGDALQTYQRAREVLIEQLGVEPGERLRRLEQAVLMQRHSLSIDLVAAGASVSWLDPDGQSQRLSLDPEHPMTIGRDPSCDVCISWDPVLSRMHARLFCDGDGWVVEDGGSRNGTFLAGTRIEGPTLLRDGDTVRCGETVLLVRTDGSTALVPASGTTMDVVATGRTKPVQKPSSPSEVSKVSKPAPTHEA